MKRNKRACSSKFTLIIHLLKKMRGGRQSNDQTTKHRTDGIVFMPKMNWDKVNRKKYGKKPDLSVVSEQARFGLRPKCKFYAISNNERFGCDEFIALGVEDDKTFCPKHQKSTFNGEALGWRMDRQIRKKFQLENRRKWKAQVKEEKLTKEMNRRYGR